MKKRAIWKSRTFRASLGAAVLLVSTTAGVARADLEDSSQTYPFPISGGSITLSMSCFTGSMTFTFVPSPTGALSTFKVITGEKGEVGFYNERDITTNKEYSFSRATNSGGDSAGTYKVVERPSPDSEEGAVTVVSGKTGCPILKDLPASSFNALKPTRVLDTRPDEPPAYSGPRPKPGTKIEIPGSAMKLPADAIAVSVQITATNSQGAGFVQAYPTGTAPGTTSNVNLLRAGQTVANSAVVKLGTDNGITVYTQAGSDVIVDVTGYFRKVSASAKPRAGRLVSFDGVRALDTRPGESINYSGAKPDGKKVLTVDLSKTGKIPAGQAAAAVINVTSTQSVRDGYVQVAPYNALKKGDSSVLNPNGSDDVAALTVVPVDSAGRFSLYTNQPSHLIVDVVGYFTSDSSKNAATRSGLFVPTNPSRALDTRQGGLQAGGLLWENGGAQGAAPANKVMIMSVPLGSSVGSAAWYNVTAVDTTNAGYLQLGGEDLKPGATSSVNYNGKGQTVANSVIAPMFYEPSPPIDAPPPGTKVFTSQSSAIVVDAAGYFVR